MGFTNHTTNYGFGQYVGTDIPSYLTDWNDTMSQIDTAIKDTADSASGLSSRLSAVEAQQTLDVADIAQAKSDITTNATAITTEAADRAAADTALGVRVGANESAITALQGDVTSANGRIDAINSKLLVNGKVGVIKRNASASSTSYGVDIDISGADTTVTTVAGTVTNVTKSGKFRVQLNTPGEIPALVVDEGSGKYRLYMEPRLQIVPVQGQSNAVLEVTQAANTNSLLEFSVVADNTNLVEAFRQYIAGATLVVDGVEYDLSTKDITLTAVTPSCSANRCQPYAGYTAYASYNVGNNKVNVGVRAAMATGYFGTTATIGIIEAYYDNAQSGIPFYFRPVINDLFGE